jgi:tryptophan synthase alpha chain
MRRRLTVYFPLADPAVPVETIDLYAGAGVDIVEFGWPARNPYLDGPDVSASMARALSGAPAAALKAARGRLARKSASPKALVMTYAERPHPALVERGVFDGVDGVLVVAPPNDERRAAIEREAREAGAAISVFVPIVPDPGDEAAAGQADFYVMLQAAAGLTGPRASVDPANAARIARLRAGGVAAPILLGFGVSNGEQARAAVGFGADGVVVGSAALRAALAGPAELKALLKDLRMGLDG